MKARSNLVAVLATLVASLMLASPPAAGTGGVCNLDFPVRFASSGAIQATGPGSVRCIGKVGYGNVDPGVFPASITGSARAMPVGCIPELTGGELVFELRPLIYFDPHPE